MPILERAALRYFCFESLESHRIVQAVFTRNGGVSPSPWRSLNLGGTVGDRAERVQENRLRVFRTLARLPGSAFEVWQVHSAKVVIARSPRAEGRAYPKGDAILTDNPQVTLLMRFADCVPILLSDPVRSVVGLVHAGWQGTVRNVVQVAVESMIAVFGSRPENITAGIGPSIGPDHYEVGEDVVSAVEQAFGTDARLVLKKTDEGTFFDLWAANRLALERSGVNEIELANLCTGCHLDDWYSHRVEGGQTGRFGALIGMQ